MDNLNTVSLERNGQIKINFDGGDLSSDAGLFLFKEFLFKIGAIKLINCMFKTNDTPWSISIALIIEKLYPFYPCRDFRGSVRHSPWNPLWPDSRHPDKSVCRARPPALFYKKALIQRFSLYPEGCLEYLFLLTSKIPFSDTAIISMVSWMDFGVLYKGSLAFFKSLNPSVNKPIVSNLAFLSVKARREHHPTGLFPTSRSDTYE